MFLLQHSWQRIIKLLFEFLWSWALAISGTLLVPSCSSHHKAQSWSRWVLGGLKTIGRKCNTIHFPSRKIIFYTKVPIWPTLNSARVIWGPSAFLRTPGRGLSSRTIIYETAKCDGWGHGLRIQSTWVQSPAPLLAVCRKLANWLNLHKPWISIFKIKLMIVFSP